MLQMFLHFGESRNQFLIIDFLCLSSLFLVIWTADGYMSFYFTITVLETEQLGGCYEGEGVYDIGAADPLVIQDVLLELDRSIERFLFVIRITHHTVHN